MARLSTRRSLLDPAPCCASAFDWLLETGAYQVALYLMWVAIDVTEKQLIFRDMQRKHCGGVRRVVGVIPNRIYIVYNAYITVV
jgi:hypothetical protein